MSTTDLAGLADPQARAALHRHLTAAAEATSAAVGLAMLARNLDAAALDSTDSWISGWTPYARDCTFLALEVLAAVAHQHLVDAGRADGFDVEHGVVDQYTAPAAACPGGAA